MVGDTKLTSPDSVKSLLSFTLLETVGIDSLEEELACVEEQWRNRLQCWAPIGLNIREDGPSRLRRKKAFVRTQKLRQSEAFL